MRWYKKVFRYVDVRIQILVEEISVADTKGESFGLTVGLAEARKVNFSALWALLRSEDNLIKDLGPSAEGGQCEF